MNHVAALLTSVIWISDIIRVGNKTGHWPVKIALLWAHTKVLFAITKAYIQVWRVHRKIQSYGTITLLLDSETMPFFAYFQHSILSYCLDPVLYLAINLPGMTDLFNLPAIFPTVFNSFT